MLILELFDIDTTLVTVLGYPLSYIEFFGTLFTVWCVWLTARANVLAWPIGIVGVTLFLFLFYQIQLYSDMLEQFYFLVTGFMGWWIWLHPKTPVQANQKQHLKISRNTARENIVYIIIIILGAAFLSYIVTNLDVWMPKLFPEPASFPILDAFTTVMSLVAQWLLMKKKIENWVLWVIVDAIVIWLYWTKGVKFISLEYVLFFFIASYGLWSWIQQYNRKE